MRREFATCICDRHINGSPRAGNRLWRRGQNAVKASFFCDGAEITSEASAEAPQKKARRSV